MKFKSEETVEEQNEVKECKCPLCEVLCVMDKQIDIISSMLSSLHTSIDTIHKLHEEHYSE